MIIRFGYVAMSLNLKNASPSKTMTLTQFKKIFNIDKELAIKKLERIAEENLQNTIRLLKYNKYENIHVYRFSSRLIPLAGHELIADWDYLAPLKLSFEEIGQIVNAENMRVSFHPDHFTLLNSARENVFEQSVDIIARHVEMLRLMNVNSKHRNVLHIGGSAGGKDKALERFINRFPLLPRELGESLIFENDDKTFTAEETLTAAEKLGQPMVLDLHHDRCNPSSSPILELWPRIIETWKDSLLPPKIHISSPKSESDFRAHADFIELEDILTFLWGIKETATHLDVMIEAKQKDNALFDLMEEIVKVEGVKQIDESTIQIL